MNTPLTSVPDLLEGLGDPDLVIVDCRWYLGEPGAGRDVYVQGHIPGARYVDLDRDLSGRRGPGRHPLPDPAAFSRTCQRLGITGHSLVVSYDDRGGAVAARLWWMLMNQGHEHVSVLDGGLDAWIASGGPLTTATPPALTGDFPTRPWRDTVDRIAVRDREDTTILIDARTAERYRGEVEPVDLKAGHIPGALSAPLTDNLDDDMTFMSPSELKTRFAALGIGDETDVISHCGSGVTACHNILAMTVAGIPMADLYVGSWSDWSASGMSVATGDSSS